MDINEAPAVKYLSLQSDSFLIAAGMTKLMVVYPASNHIERWDLLTLQREVEERLPPGVEVRGIAMGSASNGPLLVGRGDDKRRTGFINFLDIFTLKTLSTKDRLGPHPHKNWPVRASANGRAFAARSGWNPLWILKEDALSDSTLPGNHLFVVPGPDGQDVYTPEGIFSLNGQRTGALGNYCLPAVHGPFSMGLHFNDEPLHLKGEQRPNALSIHLGMEKEPIAKLKDIEFGYGVNRIDSGWMATDRRIHFIPQAKLIVTIPDSGRRALLHRFDVAEALAKTGREYLIVMSEPVRSAKRGQLYRYQLSVLSKRNPVKYELEKAPKGMTVSPTGKVEWPVPGAFPDSVSSVAIAVRDDSGQTINQTWNIEIKK
jgi:hypothetical protein